MTLNHTHERHCMNDTEKPNRSALSRKYVEGDKQLLIEIDSDGQGGWLLAVIDEHGNATRWEDPFRTEQDALAEATAAIREEGVDLFIGPPGGFGFS